MSSISKQIYLGFLLAAALPNLMRAQERPHRWDRPVALKISTEGLGAEYTFHGRFSVEVTSWVIFNAAKVRYYAWNENTSPFVGIGVGAASVRFSREGAGEWVVFHAGWEHSLGEIEIQYFGQYPIYHSAKSDTPPFWIGISAGIRL